ncbi:NLI interacting factor-like phosphatase-domain-containing protein [Morchella snyderi]|nr:NLI interacting factor-like phosphatase-domain-containing protein [Morchella snyderi]
MDPPPSRPDNNKRPPPPQSPPRPAQPPPPPPLSLLRGHSEGRLHSRDRTAATTTSRRDPPGPWSRRSSDQERQPTSHHDGSGAAYGHSYRGGGGGGSGRAGGYDRAEPARYESSTYATSSSRAHHAPSFNALVRAVSTPDYGRSLSRSASYSYPDTPVSSDGGVALPTKYEGQDYRRNAQWRANLPPPPPLPPIPIPIPGYATVNRDDSWRNDARFPHPIPAPSYRGAEPPYPKPTHPADNTPYAPRDFGSSSRDTFRGRGSSRDYHTPTPRQDVAPRRSENRYPPPQHPHPPPPPRVSIYSATTLPPRGPLSSARFRQGIDKHSRYSSTSAPPHTHKPFPPTHPSSKSSTRGKKIPHYSRHARPAQDFRPGPPSRPEHEPRGAAPPPARPEQEPRAPPPPPPPPPVRGRMIPHRSDFPPPPPPHTHIPLEKTRKAIPFPSPEYLDMSLQPARLSSATANREQLIILDLNGTLLARKCGRAKSGSINPTPRPGLRAFLSYIFKHFSVMVWSSARPDNVSLMLKALFTPAEKQMLLAEWGRDTLGLTRLEFNQKVQVYKRLDRVWEGQYRVAFPMDGKWDQTNTMLLDDSPTKAVGQPYNHVEVSEFLGTMREVREDRVLVNLVGYLEEIRWQGNVSAFIRAGPFKASESRKQVGRRVLAEFGYEEPAVGNLTEGQLEVERVDERDERYLKQKKEKKRLTAEDEIQKKMDKKARKKERKRERLEAFKAKNAAGSARVETTLGISDVEGLELDQQHQRAPDLDPDHDHDHDHDHARDHTHDHDRDHDVYDDDDVSSDAGERGQ